MTTAQAEPLNLGAAAPALTVTTDEGKTLNLAYVYKKGATLVYFYPKADTPGCTTQACNIRDNAQELNKAGVQVIGVSADSVDAQAKFKAKYKLNFPLIADQKREVIGAFGVQGRQSFLVKDGKIAWRQLKATPATQAQDAIKAASELK
jgi:peroxiredoxin Q/BCP